MILTIPNYTGLFLPPTKSKRYAYKCGCKLTLTPNLSLGPVSQGFNPNDWDFFVQGIWNTSSDNDVNFGAAGWSGSWAGGAPFTDVRKWVSTSPSSESYFTIGPGTVTVSGYGGATNVNEVHSYVNIRTGPSNTTSTLHPGPQNPIPPGGIGNGTFLLPENTGVGVNNADFFGGVSGIINWSFGGGVTITWVIPVLIYGNF